MKAWTVSDKDGEYGTVIVYAETQGKARQAVLYSDPFDFCEWTDLRVLRFKAYDQYYTGEAVPDFWHDDEHRIRLVKDYGWSCFEAFESYCKDCPARKYCEHFGGNDEG